MEQRRNSLIVEHGTTKRKIVGSFNLCGDGAYLREIARQIIAQVGDGVTPDKTGAPQRFGYGWVQIREGEQPSLVDTPPVPWDEAR
jgi:hypothetical protein